MLRERPGPGLAHPPGARASGSRCTGTTTRTWWWRSRAPRTWCRRSTATRIDADEPTGGVVYRDPGAVHMLTNVGDTTYLARLVELEVDSPIAPGTAVPAAPRARWRSGAPGRNVRDMAFRTWGRLLLTALGVSVLAGAGQLGVAYGFGIVRLTGAFHRYDRQPVAGPARLGGLVRGERRRGRRGPDRTLARRDARRPAPAGSWRSPGPPRSAPSSSPRCACSPPGPPS